ncbi:MAG: DapH/DapD/GlmU-related protein [Mycoplasma sp.]
MEKIIDNKDNKIRLVKKGVIFVDIDSNIIGKDVDIGLGTVIFPNALIFDNVKIGNNCSIFNGSILSTDIEIGNNVRIFSNVTLSKNIKLYNNTTIGQSCVIRDNVTVGDGTTIGPFSEICRTNIGCDCVLGHRNYLGDAIILDRVYFGVDASIANSNWVDTFTTIIKNDSKIGASVTIVAPVTIGENCVVSAGLTLRESLCDNTFCKSDEKLIKKENIH